MATPFLLAFHGAVAGGFQGTLPDWLVAASATGRRPENDLLLVGGTEVALS